MERKYVKWIFAIIVVMAGIVLVYAQSGQHSGQWGPGMGRRHRLAYVARYLNLTDAQKAQVKSMWEAEKPTAAPLLQQLADGRKQMLAATANGAFDAPKVQAIATQQSQVLGQLMVEKAKLDSQIYNQVLAADQRTKADELRQKQAAHLDRWVQHLAGVPAQAAPTQ